MTGIKIFRESPGVISAGAAWVCLDGPWIYVGDSLVGLLLDMIRGWRRDTHLSM